MTFGVFNFLQKTNENKSTWGIIVVKLNLFVLFLEETLCWKNHFEFVWPLGAKWKGEILLVVEIFFAFFNTALSYSRIVAQYPKVNLIKFLSSLAEWVQNSNLITTTGSWLDLEGCKYNHWTLIFNPSHRRSMKPCGQGRIGLPSQFGLRLQKRKYGWHGFAQLMCQEPKILHK